MVGSEGNMSLKNPVTPLGIDPGTVQLVALATMLPQAPSSGCKGKGHPATGRGGPRGSR